MWQSGALKSRLPPLVNQEAGHPMFYWMAAETARHAIGYCARPSFDSSIVLRGAEEYRGWKTIEQLVELAVDVQLHVPVQPISRWEETLSQDIWGAMGQIWLPQYILQRRSPYRVGQTLLMYGEAPSRRIQRDNTFPLEPFRAALRRVLGAGLEHFLFVLLQVGGRSVSDDPGLSYLALAPLKDRRYDRIVGDVDERGVFHSAYEGFFRALSAAPADMMAWSRGRMQMLDPSRTDLPARFDGPNPLTRYPLVRCFPDKIDHCLAPVPHLIHEWLYEPLMDLIAQEVGIALGPDLGRGVGAVLFEEYIGLLAERCSPAGSGWIHEDALRPLRSGRKVVDWACPLSNHVVLLDAKRSFIEPAVRGRWVSRDWAGIKNGITKGVKQACMFWSAVKAGEVPALHESATKTPVALIVVQGDSTFYNSTDTWRAEVDAAIAGLPDVVPWTVASLDIYENVMSTWHQCDEGWLPDLLLKAAQERSHKAFADLPQRAEGPLWEVYMSFVHDHVARVAPELAEQFLRQKPDNE